jgi:hypothetical protein
MIALGTLVLLLWVTFLWYYIDSILTVWLATLKEMK